MSELRQKQFEFALDLGRLLVFGGMMAESAAHAGEKIEITLGETWEDQDGKHAECLDHKKGGTHSMRLAIDLNLFVNGEYIKTDNRYWRKLAVFWKGIRVGNVWGGDFTGESAGDFNHFAREHGGRK